MICLTFLLLQVPFSIEYFFLLQQSVWSVRDGGFERKDRTFFYLHVKNVEQISLTGLQNQHFSDKKGDSFFCPKFKNILNIEQSIMTLPLQYLFALLLLPDPAVHTDLLL